VWEDIIVMHNHKLEHSVQAAHARKKLALFSAICLCSALMPAPPAQAQAAAAAVVGVVKLLPMVMRSVKQIIPHGQGNGQKGNQNQDYGQPGYKGSQGQGNGQSGSSSSGKQQTAASTPEPDSERSDGHGAAAGHGGQREEDGDEGREHVATPAAVSQPVVQSGPGSSGVWKQPYFNQTKPSGPSQGPTIMMSVPTN